MDIIRDKIDRMDIKGDAPGDCAAHFHMNTLFSYCVQIDIKDIIVWL
jgi:hypothetical protein